MDFTASSAKGIYSNRTAHSAWEQWCLSTLKPGGKDIADIGCGGGIYSRAFAKLGARSVIGIDNSGQYITEASTASMDHENITYEVADATNTGLKNNSIDIAFERALIHHFSDELQESNVIELKRILRNSGILAVQDRTYEDVVSTQPSHWIRATLLQCFPQLLKFERSRRPLRARYQQLLEQHNFHNIDVITFSELRRGYKSFQKLEEEILARKGKSILFELNDAQLKEYCTKLKQASIGKNLEEVDQWTIWLAKAPSP